MRLDHVEDVAATPDGTARGATFVDLETFLETTGELSGTERRGIVDRALFVMEEVYVHLPLKRAMHAIDPVQRLKLLRRTAGAMDERRFHDEMVGIFTSLRDLHTNYVLPDPYRRNTAFLPFLMEEYYDADGARRYIVTRMLVEFEHPEFKAGVEVTHWSGVPVDLAVDANAEREAGSNAPARHVRGLDSMTVRPMAMSLPPLERWVIVGYTDADGEARELRLPWQVLRDDGSAMDAVWEGFADDRIATAIGMDLNLELTNRARLALFVRGPEGGRDDETLRGDTARRPPRRGRSFFPDTFEFREIEEAGRSLGYLRIRTFSEPPPEDFIPEVIRIVEALPQEGLIIDVRGNGGGIILNGERMLQLFTDRTIEAERLQFINTETTGTIAASDALGGFAKEWAPSIALSVATGAVYSQGFPIESRAETNAIGRRYPGKVVLVTDARCYSTTDIFAAGFQDHAIGPILGTDMNTGAGGANVFTYGLLRRAMRAAGLSLAVLPGGADLRMAIRRTIRVGPNAGLPVEDLGVTPDALHRLTRNDVLDRNGDLIAAAAGLLR